MKQSIQTKYFYIALIIMLIISDLPNIIIKEVLNFEPNKVFIFKFVFIMFLFLLTYFYQLLKPLKNYLLIFSLAFFLRKIGSLVIESQWYGALMNQFNSNIIVDMASVLIPRFIFAIILFLILLVIKNNRKNFFMVKGNSSATTEPIKGMIKERISWSKFGPRFTLYLTFGLLIFLISVAELPTINGIIEVLQVFPFILIFAAINSFNEELIFRASIISVLEDQIGGTYAVILTSIYFGLAHFYGVPYGIVGVLLSTFLGFILGKSMVETRGSFWALTIHFVMDVIIFSFLALGSVTAGGL